MTRDRLADVRAAALDVIDCMTAVIGAADDRDFDRIDSYVKQAGVSNTSLKAAAQTAREGLLADERRAAQPALPLDEEPAAGDAQAAREPAGDDDGNVEPNTGDADQQAPDDEGDAEELNPVPAIMRAALARLNRAGVVTVGDLAGDGFDGEAIGIALRRMVNDGTIRQAPDSGDGAFVRADTPAAKPDLEPAQPAITPADIDTAAGDVIRGRGGGEVIALADAEQALLDAGWSPHLADEVAPLALDELTERGYLFRHDGADGAVRLVVSGEPPQEDPDTPEVGAEPYDPEAEDDNAQAADALFMTYGAKGERLRPRDIHISLLRCDGWDADRIATVDADQVCAILCRAGVLAPAGDDAYTWVEEPEADARRPGRPVWQAPDAGPPQAAPSNLPDLTDHGLDEGAARHIAKRVYGIAQARGETTGRGLTRAGDDMPKWTEGLGDIVGWLVGRGAIACDVKPSNLTANDKLRVGDVHVIDALGEPAAGDAQAAQEPAGDDDGTVEPDTPDSEPAGDEGASLAEYAAEGESGRNYAALADEFADTLQRRGVVTVGALGEYHEVEPQHAIGAAITLIERGAVRTDSADVTLATELTAGTASAPDIRAAVERLGEKATIASVAAYLGVDVDRLASAVESMVDTDDIAADGLERDDAGPDDIRLSIPAGESAQPDDDDGDGDAFDLDAESEAGQAGFACTLQKRIKSDSRGLDVPAGAGGIFFPRFDGSGGGAFVANEPRADGTAQEVPISGADFRDTILSFEPAALAAVRALEGRAAE